MSSPTFLPNAESRIEEVIDQGAQTEQEQELFDEGQGRGPSNTVPVKKRGSGRRIPFLPNSGSGRRRGTNYAQEYPPDELGGEMAPNARVWRIYLDEADEYDAEMMESFKDTTDVLLVFAGLFSAVVTTFVSQASQALQPDYAQVTASLLTELVLLQRAIATGTPITDIPISQLSFSNAQTTTSLDRWVNGLWFTSLSLSLVSALLSVLVKQWLQHYISALSGTPRERVLVHHFRLIGLQTWKVSEIIQTLPVLLHIALFMFMAGLVIFVWALDLGIAYTICIITATCFLSYSISNILPAFYPSCSYKTPLSQLYSSIWSALRWLATVRIRRAAPFQQYAHSSHVRQLLGFQFSISGWISVQNGKKQVEMLAPASEIDSILFSSLTWLHSTSSDPSASGVVVESMAGLPLFIDQKKQTSVIIDVIWERLYTGGEPQGLGADLGATIVACCAICGHIWLSDDFYDAYTALLPNASPIMQRLSAFVTSDTVPSERISPDIISGQTLLPPWMWKSLFENGKWDRSDPLALLVALLNVLKEAEAASMWTPIKFGGANWTLPSTLGLIQLCRLDGRMAIVILRFACGRLSAPSASTIHAHLNALTGEETNRRSALIPQEINRARPLVPAIVHFIHGILDQIQARLEVIGPIQDYLAAVESSLLSVPTPDWLEPRFIDALHRCTVMKNQICVPDHSTSIPLHHREPVATSTTLLLLYILDILQHPWPLFKVADITDPYLFTYLCYQLFSRQERGVFEALINNNGLSTFRRCFPCWFMVTVTPHYTSSIFVPYLKFVTTLDDEDSKHQHLSVISQRDNLAWLIWLSLYPGQHALDVYEPSPRKELCRLLRALPIEKQRWLEATGVLVEELRRDSALYGITGLIYADLEEGLKALGLREDEFKIYGYVSDAWEVEYPIPASFQRVTELGDEDSIDPTYGPYAVYYSTPAFPQSSPSKSWSQNIRGALRRIKPTPSDPERGTET